MSFMFLSLVGANPTGSTSGGGNTIVLSNYPTPINSILLDIQEENNFVDLEDKQMLALYMEPQTFVVVLQEPEE